MTDLKNRQHETKENTSMGPLKRLVQPFLAGIACGMLVIWLRICFAALPFLTYSNPALYSLANQWSEILSFSLGLINYLLFPASFLQMVSQYGYVGILLPFTIWFIIGFVTRLVSRNNRATTFICIGLFLLNVLIGYLVFVP
ncbi:MAG: hypothetical protein WCF84_02980 [Anaerolineae bacterium]